MSRPTIDVDGLSKSYRIGQKSEQFKSFREAIAGAVRAPLRRLTGAGRPRARAATFWALREVSFRIDPGEVVGVIGRNGAGKSTLLKVLSRITGPTEGCVRIRGRVSSLLEVGTGFHPELTGRENIFLNGSILGMRRAEIERKFDEIVSFAEVEQFLDTPVKYYSSGMYIRLAFAVAAHLETQILIVDEVLAVGDTGFQKKCLGRIEEVTREGRTVLFVSHNMPAVQNLCTRCLFMDQGRLTMDGAPRAVLEAYNAATAGWTTSEMSLEDHPGRASDAQTVMRRVRVTGSGITESYVCMGDDLTIEVRFRTDTPLNDLTFWVFVKNSMNVNVFGVDTDTNPPPPYEGPVTSGTVVCRIERLPLMPGTYSLDLYLGSRNMNIDVVHDACSFEVHPADVFGTGKLPHPVSGNVFWPSAWKIIPGEPSPRAT